MTGEDKEDEEEEEGVGGRKDEEWKGESGGDCKWRSGLNQE